MNIAELTVEVRNSSLERVAQITELELVGFTAVLRFNNVGSWKTTLPADSIAAEQLRQPGAGIIVTGPSGVILSGPTTSAKKIQNADDPNGVWEIEGVDDSVLLLERLAYPDPSEPDAGLQTIAYDEITGPASTVLYHYVDVNLGPTAPVERQVPALTLAPDLALGSTTIGKLRFDVLGAAFSKLVAPDGLGFDIKQQNGELVFSVFQPVDRSGEIRLDVQNNRLSASEYVYENPKATRAIVAGQGQGEARELLEVTTTEAENSEAEWGRRIEVFKDQRDAEDAALLEQSGIELLAKEGKTLEGISVTPADDGSMRYGFDWNLGDKVSVVANETTAVAVVTEVALSVEENGIFVIATIGEPDTASTESKAATTQSNQENRISNLERNSAGGGGGGTGGGGSIGYYGSFYDMTDQPLASITAAQPIAIGTTAEAVGISITGGNKVTFANAGTYSLTFSIQITNLSGSTAKSVFWVKKDGVDYPDSATELDLAPRKSSGVPNRQVITINYVATADVGTEVQIWWAGDNLELKVESLPAGTSPVYPAVPSIILTVVQVGNSGLVVSPSEPSSTGVLWLDTDETSDIPVPIGGTAGQVLAKIDEVNYNTQWINQVVAPAGVISQFAGITPPIGYLLCEGQSLSTTAYADLFSVIGYRYGGSGSTFNIPNLRGRIPVGLDPAQAEFDAMGEVGGEKAVTLAASQLPAHSHPNSLTGTTTFASSGHAHGAGSFHAAIGAVAGNIATIGYVAGYNSGGPGSATYAISASYIGGPGFSHYTPVYGATGGPNATASVGISNANNTGGGSAHNNLQPYVVVNYIIKT